MTNMPKLYYFFLLTSVQAKNERKETVFTHICLDCFLRVSD